MQLHYSGGLRKQKKDGMGNEGVADNFTDEMSSIIGNVKGAMNRTEELKKMTPTTDAEFWQWLPEFMLGLPHESTEAYAKNAPAVFGFITFIVQGTRRLKTAC